MDPSPAGWVGGRLPWRLEARHAHPWPGLPVRADQLALRFPVAPTRWLELDVGQLRAGIWTEQWLGAGIAVEPRRGAGVAVRLGGRRASWGAAEELRGTELGLHSSWRGESWAAGGGLSLRHGWPGDRPRRQLWGEWISGPGAARLERRAGRWGGGPRWRSAWSHAAGPARIGLEIGPGEGAAIFTLRRQPLLLALRWQLLGERAGGSELLLRWSP